MKKSLFLLALCSVLASMTVSVAAEDEYAATAREATIKPVIDGVIDDVWVAADKMYGTEYGGELTNDNIVASYASLMWDDEGLYLLGVMYDVTYPEVGVDTGARNSIDLWVSETYTDDTAYSADGDWHYCKASTGEEVYYTGNETVYDEATTAVQIYDDHYVVEIFCPWQTEGYNPEIGGFLGFTVSFNDDANGDGERDMYSYWKTTEFSEAYWSETMALPKIQFVAGPEVAADEPAADEPAVDAPATEAPVTADAGIVAAAAVMAAAAGVVLSKKH